VNDINIRKNKLAKIISGYSSKKILVIGDVMLDEYIWGTVIRISPEAPVPVVEVKKRIYTLGGAGNVAANITSLGGQAKLGGIIGEDERALILLKELNKLSIKSEGILKDKNYPTITKTRIIAHDQQIVRLDIESCRNIENDLEDKLLSWADRSMSSVQACIISDYGKNVISVRIAQSVITMAQNLNIPVVVDPKGLDYKKYIGATIITPNIQEAQCVLNCEINNGDDLYRAGIKLNDLVQGSAVLITKGAAGMSLFIDGDKAIDIPTIAKRLYDVTGAGDTVVSTLSISLAAGATLEQAAFLANQAAGLVVGKLGTATVSCNELVKSLN